jgi:Na+/melibiose symporter-like transporter
VVAVSALVWATIQAPTDGWTSAPTVRNFTISIALLVCFAAWELRCSHPMLELHFFRNRRFSVACVASGIANYSFAGMMFVLTQLLQFVFGYTPLAAGVAIMPMAVAFMAAGLLGPRLAERVGTKRAVSAALAIFGVALLVLASTDETSSVVVVLAATLLVGVGFGFTLAPTTDAVMGAVPKEQAGIASGTLSATRQVGTALGVAVVGSLLVSGYRSVFASHTRGLQLSGTDADTARTSLGSALTVAHDVGGAAGRVVADAARVAFVHGMRIGMISTAVLLGVGSLLALRYLPAHAHEGVPPEEIGEFPVLDIVTE